MITEEFVQFETAKLLKECGFPQKLDDYVFNYNQEGEEILMEYCDWNTAIARPSQSLAMRWFRENKRMSVDVFSSLNGDHYTMQIVDFRIREAMGNERYETYEVAAENGIIAACKYLKSKQL